MSLTKNHAVTEHRKLWNWVADATERREHCVDKWEYFIENELSTEKIPFQNCFCCEYSILKSSKKDVDYCTFCPVQWNTTDNSNDCKCVQGEYGRWSKAYRDGDYERAAKIARKIANLPVAETNSELKTIWLRFMKGANLIWSWFRKE